jgi:hypothetical protein
MNLKTVKATKGAGFFYVYRSTNIIMIEKWRWLQWVGIG